MDMSISPITPTAHIDAPTCTKPDRGGLHNSPAGEIDRDFLRDHLGRDVIPGCVGRDFSTAYTRRPDGTNSLRMYRFDTEALGRCEYVMLTSAQYAAVLVVDVDQPGTPGGDPANLNPYVREVVRVLVYHHIEPAWVGINPMSGKAQFIWLIDPVYADKGGESSQMKLLAATTRVLGELLDHDPHFSHRFSRSPFYKGKSPTAYRWYRQHNRVVRIGDLIKQVRDLAGQEQFNPNPRQKFTSGRELINAVKTRREQAQAFKALTQDTDVEIAGELDRYDPELIDGVRVLWSTPGVAARDETAFRHALKTGHRLRQQGKRLTDAALIDAYEHAYAVAHEHGGAGRRTDMPPMRDRLTMARRVRGYVTQSKSGAISDPYRGVSTLGAGKTASSSERKALATMGRKGGQKAAQRWKTDPQGDYAQLQREKLAAANKKRERKAQGNKMTIAGWFFNVESETGKYPTLAEAMAEFEVSKSTVKRALSAARVELPRGRKQVGK